MKDILSSKKVFLIINIVIIAVIFILNYFYQSNNFNYTLKCICSSCFALLGLINLAYALVTNQAKKHFYAAMAAGCVLAFSGDVVINLSFIPGAGLFALGHVCFIIAYGFLRKFRSLDFLLIAVIAVASIAIVLFCPVLEFSEPILRWVCVAYATIISAMLGKSIANFIHQQNVFYAILAAGSLLFFFSDLMLLLDWFAGLWSWTNEACMATYYPALCLLAFSMHHKAVN